jgi:hypothetical protein
MTKHTVTALNARARVAKLLGWTGTARALEARARVAALLAR